LVQAKFVHSNFLLLALDVVIFLVLRAAWESLPRQRTAQKVEQYVADSFQIVASALLVSNVSVNRRVPGSARQVLALAEWDVLVVRVFVALGQPEVDYIYVILCTFCASDQEVVWLNVAVNDALFMYFLNALDLRN
jgi:hypothetical protein